MTLTNPPFAVIPVLTGPLQVLIAILPGLLCGLFTVFLSIIVSLFKPSVLKQGVLLLWRLKLPIAAVLIICFGGIWAARALWPTSYSTGAALEKNAKDWPMFRGGLTRRGSLPDAIGPTRGGLNWGWKKSGVSFFGSPALVGNRIYVAAAEVGAISEAGWLSCFDADTGAVLWEAAPPGYRPTFSSPSVSGKYLVCGEGLHKTRDARIVCYELKDRGPPTLLWTFATTSHVECTPVIDNDRVYVGAGDDGYYCLDLLPDAKGNARVLWHAPGKDYPDAETSLAVFGGKVYAGLGNGGKALCVLDAATGKQLHRLPTPYPVFGPPAIADGKLYLGMGNGDYVFSAEEIRDIQLQRLKDSGATPAQIEQANRDLAPGGEVWCIDLANLQIDWKYRVDQTVLGAIAVTPDALYFGCRDGHLVQLNRKGELKSRWNGHAPIIASPAVTDRHVYLVTNAGMLYALDRISLDPVWEFRLGTQPLFVSSPTVGRGRVWIGTQYDGLLCVGEPGERETPSWTGHLGGPGAAGVVDSSIIPGFPEIRWNFPTDGDARTPAAVVADSVYVPLPHAAQGLVCLKSFPADPTKPAVRWSLPTRHGVYLSPAVYGERVFVVDGKPWEDTAQVPAEDRRHLYCSDTRGKLLWKAALSNSASGHLAATDDAAYVQDSLKGLSRYSHDGGKIWTQPVGRLEHPPCIAAWIVVCAVADPPALVALDRGTGAELWRQSLPKPAAATPVVARTTIYLGTPDALDARSLIDGQRLANWKGKGGVSTDFAVRRDDIAYVSTTGELMIVKRPDGKVVARYPDAVPGFPPLVGRDTILYVARPEGSKAGSTSIMQVQDGQASIWMDADSLGRIITPLLLADSHIYVGVEGKGLVQLGAAP